jgi:hypothetical protein
MKIKFEQLRRIIKEEITLAKSGENQRFLHGPDDEGAMVKSSLSAVMNMASDIQDVMADDDQLPGWVQDHLSVAHENLQQVHGYLMGTLKQESRSSNQKKNISESISKITTREIKEWSKGNWGFISETSQSVDPDRIREVWEDLGGYNGSKVTVEDIALELRVLPTDVNMNGTGLVVLDGVVQRESF